MTTSQRRWFLFFFLQGLITGLCLWSYQSFQRHITLFYTPDFSEAFLDGEALNYVGMPPRRHRKLVFRPINLGARYHPYGFFQFVDRMKMWTLPDLKLEWETEFRDGVAPFERDPREQYLPTPGILGGLGVQLQATFTLNKVPDSFMLEWDYHLGDESKLYWFDEGDEEFFTFHDQLYAGNFLYLTGGGARQKYFIPPNMWWKMATGLGFKYLGNLLAAQLLLALLAMLAAGYFWGGSAVARTLPRLRNGVISLADWLGREGKSARDWLVRHHVPALFIALCAVGFCNDLSRDVFIRIPHVNDEGNYLFQAKIFSEGKVCATPPEQTEFFKYLGVWWDDCVFSYYTFGHSALIAIGYWIGEPWMIPIVITGLAVFFTVLAGTILYGPLVGVVAGALVSTSPLVMLLGASYMSHISALMTGIAFLYFLVKADQTERFFPAIAAGAFLGWCFNVRPVTAVYYSALPLLFMVFSARSRRRWGQLVLFGVAGAAVASLAFLHAYATTGIWNLIQTHQEPFKFGNDWVTFWKYTNQNGSFFLLRIFGWPPYFALMFAAIPFLLGSRKKWDWLLAGSVILNAVGYSALAHFGWTHEPRYWSELVPLCAILSGRGIQRAGEFLAARFPARGMKPLVQGVGCAAGLGLILFSFRFYWPSERNTYTDYCNVRARTWREVMALDAHNAILFLKGYPDYAYIPYYTLNATDYEGDVIYAMDKADENQKLMDQYPSRSAYRVEDFRPIERLR